MNSVSVVVIGRNVGGRIRGTLESAARVSANAKEMRVHEIVVVNDGSTDETPAVIDAFIRESHAPRTMVLGTRSAHGNRGAARNLGAEAATGELLLFVDAGV